jgi:hypothetical protein
MRCEEKLLKILRELTFRVAYFNQQHEDRKGDKLYIERHELRRLIMGQLDIIDAHRVNGWIDKLISSNFISMNPHTSLSSKMHVYKPTPNTRYFIEATTISEFLATHTQQTQLTLSYGESP